MSLPLEMRKPDACSPVRPAHADTYSQIGAKQFASGADVNNDNTVVQ